MSPTIRSRRSNLIFLSLPALAVLCVAGAGCGSSNDGPSGGPVSMPSALDDHCVGVTPVVVDQASCTATPPADGVEETADVHYNAESDDDDCKYHVSFTTTPVRLNEGATFTVTVTTLAGAKGPVTGAKIVLEGTLNDAFALPNGPMTSENTPGVYVIAPVKFNKSGRWVITYHLFETCADLTDSPHGHASFYIDVP